MNLVDKIINISQNQTCGIIVYVYNQISRCVIMCVNSVTTLIIMTLEIL